jgi:hypothetical protein
MTKFHFLGMFVAAFLAANYNALGPPKTTPQPIVIELFTSEGCSSCPPADALLGQLSQQRTGHAVDLVLLGEHVEYWDGQGWKDRFSAPVFTQRQYDYVHYLHLATAYTPQVVVDGHLQASGGNASALQQLIAEAAETAKPSKVSLQLLSPDKLQVNVSAPPGPKWQVLFAITEDNLTTNVRGGENKNRVLTHSAVVRELHSLGSTSDGHFEKTFAFKTKSDWKPQDLRAIVLVQEQSTGQIQGAATIPLANSSTLASGR